MRVRDLLRSKDRRVVTAASSTPVREAMRLLIENRISCLPVITDGDRLIGIISDKDIFRKVHETDGVYHELTVGELMTSDLLVGVEDDDVRYIAGVMTNNRIRHVPIVESQKLIGLLSIGDVVKIQMENIQIENRYLKDYIDGSYPR